MNLLVMRVYPGARLPTRGSEHAAGLDLYTDSPGVIRSGERGVVDTGVAVAIPEGHVGLIWPRSGLAVKHGIDVLAGVIDSDYRGEVRVAMINHGREDFEIESGMRIAQLLIQPITKLDPVEVDALPDTERGDGGFGSTGQ